MQHCDTAVVVAVGGQPTNGVCAVGHLVTPGEGATTGKDTQGEGSSSLGPAKAPNQAGKALDNPGREQDTGRDSLPALGTAQPGLGTSSLPRSGSPEGNRNRGKGETRGQCPGEAMAPVPGVRVAMPPQGSPECLGTAQRVQWHSSRPGGAQRSGTAVPKASRAQGPASPLPCWAQLTLGTTHTRRTRGRSWAQGARALHPPNSDNSVPRQEMGKGGAELLGDADTGHLWLPSASDHPPVGAGAKLSPPSPQPSPGGGQQQEGAQGQALHPPVSEPRAGRSVLLLPSALLPSPRSPCPALWGSGGSAPAWGLFGVSPRTCPACEMGEKGPETPTPLPGQGQCQGSSAVLLLGWHFWFGR